MPESDYLEDEMHKQWCNILKIYKLFEKKKPIMLFDIQEERIYAYPYAEFRDELNERSKLSLTEQYEEAIKENKLVVFVRDNVQKKLVSFSMPLGSTDALNVLVGTIQMSRNPFLEIPAVVENKCNNPPLCGE